MTNKNQLTRRQQCSLLVPTVLAPEFCQALADHIAVVEKIDPRDYLPIWLSKTDNYNRAVVILSYEFSDKQVTAMVDWAYLSIPKILQEVKSPIELASIIRRCYMAANKPSK